jgi:hypothetical protein
MIRIQKSLVTACLAQKESVRSKTSLEFAQNANISAAGHRFQPVLMNRSSESESFQRNGISTEHISTNQNCEVNSSIRSSNSQGTLRHNSYLAELKRLHTTQI